MLDIQLPSKSGRQSSVSTNNQPGVSENVRLLLQRKVGGSNKNTSTSQTVLN